VGVTASQGYRSETHGPSDQGHGLVEAPEILEDARIGGATVARLDALEAGGDQKKDLRDTVEERGRSREVGETLRLLGGPRHMEEAVVSGVVMVEARVEAAARGDERVDLDGVEAGASSVRAEAQPRVGDHPLDPRRAIEELTQMGGRERHAALPSRRGTLLQHPAEWKVVVFQGKEVRAREGDDDVGH